MPGLTMTQSMVAPVELVFDLATDLPRAAEHIDGIDKIEMVTEGPVGVGARWRETRTMFGRSSTEELEVTAFDRPNSYRAAGESCGCAFEFTFRFQPTVEGTDVTLEMTWRAVTLAAKLMSPLGSLMMSGCKKAVQQDLLDLKRAAETKNTRIMEDSP